MMPFLSINIKNNIMKKIFLGAILSIAMFFVSSCSNDDLVTTCNDTTTSQSLQNISDEELQELACLKGQINVLSDENFGNRPKTRSIWKKFKLFFCDAAGFLKGIVRGDSYKQAVASGALASIESLVPKDTDTSSNGDGNGSYTTITNYVSPINEKTNINLVAISKKPCAVDSAGIYHNEIVRRTLVNNAALIKLLNASSKELVDTVAYNTEIELNLKHGSITSDTKLMDTLLKDAEMFKQLRDSLDTDNIISTIAKSNAQEAKILTVIKEYTDGIKDPEDAEKNKEYTEQVLNIIEEANISEEMKTALKGCIAVGYASSNLWNTNAEEVK